MEIPPSNDSLKSLANLFLIPKPHQGWRPMTDISRLTPLSTSRKVQMETPESILASLILGEWVSFPSYKLKEVPDIVLRVDNKSGEVRTQPTQVFPFVGYKFHLDLALVNPLREMAQFSGFDPTFKVKHVFDFRMFDVANWVACLNGENGPRGMPSHEAHCTYTKF